MKSQHKCPLCGNIAGGEAFEIWVLKLILLAAVMGIIASILTSIFDK